MCGCFMILSNTETYMQVQVSVCLCYHIFGYLLILKSSNLSYVKIQLVICSHSKLLQTPSLPKSSSSLQKTFCSLPLFLH